MTINATRHGSLAPGAVLLTAIAALLAAAAIATGLIAAFAGHGRAPARVFPRPPRPHPPAGPG